MNLPSLSIPWLLAIAFAVGGVVAGVPAYKAGAAVQAKTDNAAMASAIANSEARAVAAEAGRAEQARVHAEELAKRDTQEQLAERLFEDARAHINETEQRLSVARKQLKELRNDPHAQPFLDAPVPDAVRDSLCAARAEACD